MPGGGGGGGGGDSGTCGTDYTSFVSFLDGAGGATDTGSQAAEVTLDGDASFSACGLDVDGDADRARIANYDYASDGSWTVGFWFSKTGCTTGPWEYIYS
eukprot:COSAG04_NODE_4653_length_1967_cov_1.402034_2_plen_99_part_01